MAVGTRRRWTALLVVGVALVVAGVLVLLLSPFPYSYGWTAYSPLSDVTYSPGPPRWTLLLTGALLVGGGFLAGLAVATLRTRRRDA